MLLPDLSLALSIKLCCLQIRPKFCPSRAFNLEKEPKYIPKTMQYVVESAKCQKSCPGGKFYEFRGGGGHFQLRWGGGLYTLHLMILYVNCISIELEKNFVKTMTFGTLESS